MVMSAGILLYRRGPDGLEYFLVHPGGPFWAKKDLGSWSIPKGEFTPEEEPLAAAQREFKEETGFEVSGPFEALEPQKQRSGKLVFAWACEGQADAASIKSNMFSMEWPPRSGKMREFPEVDRAEWFSYDEAKKRIVSGQAGFLDEGERRFFLSRKGAKNN
jgi:predicted NUDIX family NTP pyrophosphohydrolase